MGLEMKLQRVLETERLYLRSFCEEDADRVQSIVGDKRISDMVSNIPHPYPEGGALSWIRISLENFQQGKNVVYAVIAKDTNLVVGAMSFKLLPDSEAEIGYWLGVDYWGKGYCTEAAKALIAYGLSDLKLKRLMGRHLTVNPDSGNVLTKLGMKHFDSCEGECGDKFANIEFYELFANA